MNVCKVCRHREAARIAALILDGASNRFIAAQVGSSASAIQRHRGCLARIPSVVRGIELQQERAAQDLGEFLLARDVDFERYATKSEAVGDYRAATAATRARAETRLRAEEVVSARPSGAAVKITFNFGSLRAPAQLEAVLEAPDAAAGQREEDEP